MVRIFVDPQPFPSRADGFCETPDRPRTVCSRYRSDSAITVASAIRSVPPRVLLAQRSVPDEGEVRAAGIRSTGRCTRRRAGPKWPLQRHSKAGALIATATAAERVITGELALKNNTS
jgi:hypothetical protein